MNPNLTSMLPVPKKWVVEWNGVHTGRETVASHDLAVKKLKQASLVNWEQ